MRIETYQQTTHTPFLLLLFSIFCVQIRGVRNRNHWDNNKNMEIVFDEFGFTDQILFLPKWNQLRKCQNAFLYCARRFRPIYIPTVIQSILRCSCALAMNIFFFSALLAKISTKRRWKSRKKKKKNTKKRKKLHVFLIRKHQAYSSNPRIKCRKNDNNDALEYGHPSCGTIWNGHIGTNAKPTQDDVIQYIRVFVYRRQTCVT